MTTTESRPQQPIDPNQQQFDAIDFENMMLTPDTQAEEAVNHAATVNEQAQAAEASQVEVTASQPYTFTADILPKEKEKAVAAHEARSIDDQVDAEMEKHADVRGGAKEIIRNSIREKIAAEEAAKKAPVVVEAAKDEAAEAKQKETDKAQAAVAKAHAEAAAQKAKLLERVAAFAATNKNPSGPDLLKGLGMSRTDIMANGFGSYAEMKEAALAHQAAEAERASQAEGERRAAAKIAAEERRTEARLEARRQAGISQAAKWEADVNKSRSAREAADARIAQLSQRDNLKYGSLALDRDPKLAAKLKQEAIATAAEEGLDTSHLAPKYVVADKVKTVTKAEAFPQPTDEQVETDMLGKLVRLQMKYAGTSGELSKDDAQRLESITARLNKLAERSNLPADMLLENRRYTMSRIQEQLQYSDDLRTRTFDFPEAEQAPSPRPRSGDDLPDALGTQEPGSAEALDDEKARRDPDTTINPLDTPEAPASVDNRTPEERQAEIDDNVKDATEQGNPWTGEPATDEELDRLNNGEPFYRVFPEPIAPEPVAPQRRRLLDPRTWLKPSRRSLRRRSQR